MKSPCYNEETKSDCPRRKAGCAVDCPEWAKYVKARDAEYLKKRADYDVVHVLSSSRRERDIVYGKNRIVDRTRRRKR